MKTRLAVVALLLAAGLAGGCDKQPGPPEPVDLTAHELKVLEQGNHFGFDLFNQLALKQPDSNLCISPYSIYTALSMAVNGADGQTLTEMLGLLGFPGGATADLNASLKNLNEVLIAKDPLTVFETANSVWYNTDGFEVYPDFVSNMKTYYDARVEGISFSSPQALPAVNGWVKEQTHDKIEKIIEQIMPQDVCYLINALYFNGKWVTKFDKKETRKGYFQLSSGNAIEVPTMHLEDTVSAILSEELQAVELPYGDGSWSMYLFLPPQGTDLNDWCREELTPNWGKLREQFTPVPELKLYLPQFKLESSFELSEQLKQMGMPTAFSPSADFSKLGPGPLAISQVLHKTFIDVNEDGTEAAAVTAVIITRTSMPMNEVRFNRPFAFVIAEKSTGTVIFAGKLMKPN